MCSRDEGWTEPRYNISTYIRVSHAEGRVCARRLVALKIFFPAPVEPPFAVGGWRQWAGQIKYYNAAVVQRSSSSSRSSRHGAVAVRVRSAIVDSSRPRRRRRRPQTVVRFPASSVTHNLLMTAAAGFSLVSPHRRCPHQR